ncbi:MAG: hypothetical protein LCI00_08475 [Chloroflexi bacterium]|nr:hypothetical protein [Chloroflexota bacterium]
MRNQHSLGGVWHVLLLIGLVIVGLGMTPAFAHGAAELTVAPSAVAPNGAITVSADGVEDGEIFTITLDAPTFTVRLGGATADGDSFSQDYIIPGHVPPGDYQVNARTADGEVISAELTVQAEASASPQTAMVEPSAAPMQLDRSKPTIQVVAIVVGLLLTAGIGAVLVRARE